MSCVGFVICIVILCVIVAEKFFQGGWLTLVVMGLLVAVFACVHRHYRRFAKKMQHVDRLLTLKELQQPEKLPELDPSLPTAVVFVNEHTGLGVHTLLWANRLFPGHFKNYIFLQVGLVDIKSFSGESELETMQASVNQNLDYFEKYAHSIGAAAESYAGYGTQAVEELLELVSKVSEKYPGAIYFSSKIILSRSSLLGTFLHNRTGNHLQARLHMQGQQMILLPMNIRM